MPGNEGGSDRCQNMKKGALYSGTQSLLFCFLNIRKRLQTNGFYLYCSGLYFSRPASAGYIAGRSIENDGNVCLT